MGRVPISIQQASKIVLPKDSYHQTVVDKVHGNLVLPSYVHGYSLAIEYITNWFRSKFPKDYFVGGVYIDGKNVLDDYKRLNDFLQKAITKGQNPRARIEPRVQYDYDRDNVDFYMAPPELYLKRSRMQQAFFKDYDRNLFLGMEPRALRMDFNFKVRVNSRAQQQDIYSRMELYFRVGATQRDMISADFHVPSQIMLDIAEKAGFKVKNECVVDVIEFVQYLNRHSEMPFLFKLRAINQRPEFFIRMNNLYTHIAIKDKLQLDDGERDGKLDFNFHVEMNAVLTIPIPHYYAYYTEKDLMGSIPATAPQKYEVPIYSINLFDIPKVDEHGWAIAASVDYITDTGDTELDVSHVFSNENSTTTRLIKHELLNGISPSRFINVHIYRDDDVNKELFYEKVDWKNMKIIFREPESERVMHVAFYTDREFINTLDIELNKYRSNRTEVNK